MDKNQISGFVLIGLILVGFYFLTKPKENIDNQIIQDTVISIQDTNNQQITNDTVIIHDTIDNQVVLNDTTVDSLVAVQLTQKYGAFANAATGEQEFTTVENNKIKIVFTNKGGRIYSVQLKDFVTHSQDSLILFSGDSNRFNMSFYAEGNKLIQTEQLYFQPEIIETDTAKIVSFKAKISDSKYLEFAYILKDDKYLIDFDVNFVNLSEAIAVSNTFVVLNWDEYVKHLEQGEKWERQNTLLYYKLLNDNVEKMSNRKTSEEEITAKVRWVSYKQQFFNSTLIAESSFDNATLKCEALPDDTVNMFLMSSKLSVPFQANDTKLKFKYYFGPNNYSDLRKIAIGDTKLQIDKIIPLGGKYLGIINKGVIIPLFNFLGRFISNYGIIILVLTLIIKLVLFPLTYKSYASAAKMKILKPEIDKALEKIPKDKQMERQQATMALYKKAGVSPMGGCLPTLLQMPILIALYRFFPSSIELRQKSFLWAKDLSSYDAIVSWHGNIPIVNMIFGNHISLFTLLMAVTMVFNTMLTSANSTMDASNPQGKSMKYMMYLMPVMMIVWFNGYSAGLSYYYFLSTLIGVIQVLLIRKFIDEEKVLNKLRINMKNKKEVKKSKFQARLEEVQKQQNRAKKKR